MINVPKNISETIKKSDTFNDHKTGVKARDSQGLDFMQQVEESSDKGGKGRGGPVHVQVGCGQSTNKQDRGGNADSSNTNLSTTNGCHLCGKTDHILHFWPDLTKNQRADLYLQMKKQTEDKKKAEEKSAPIEEGQLNLQVDPTEVSVDATDEDILRES